MAATVHPAYLEAGEQRRWGGRLAELLPALRPEKRETALRSIDNVEGALRDLEVRARKLIGWLERHATEEEHGGATLPPMT